MTAEEMEARLTALADEGNATVLQRFFKTGPGQYGAGDRFLGVKVPQVRKAAAACRDAPSPRSVDCSARPGTSVACSPCCCSCGPLPGATARLGKECTSCTWGARPS
jgi:hypothetical protein